MTSNDLHGHDQELDWAQVARYLSGELSPGEARALERWFERDQESRRVLAESRAAWGASAPVQGAWNVDGGIKRLREAVDAMAASPAPARRRPILAWTPRRMIPATLAASIAALAVSGLAFWSLHRSNVATTLPAPVAMNEVVTPPGQRADVLLPDGSRVTLNVASRLRYPRDFGVGSRTLYLDGEAFFQVIHDGARPFRVRAGVGEFEDVGTAFVIRAYEDREARVVVTEGVVIARRPAAPADSVVLSAAELAQVDERRIVQQNDVPIDRYVAWIRGELVFDDATLGEVADELARWYEVDVRVDTPAIGNRRFTGLFHRQSADAVIRAIAAATDVTAERVDGGWIFR